MDKTPKYHGIILISVVLVSLATVYASWLISKTSFTIQNASVPTTTSGQLTNTIAVNGDGKVFAKPDMVIINVTASELANTTKDAMAKVNDKMNEVMGILKTNNIPEKDIQTSTISLSPEYDWSTTPKYLKGQRVTEGLTINIKKIDPTAEKVSTIIDAVSAINNIELGGITFDIEDKTPFYTQARELAFQKAKQKATELAKLGDVELLKPVSISDTSVNYYPPVYSNAYMMNATKSTDAAGSQIATGQLEVDITVNVMWGIK